MPFIPFANSGMIVGAISKSVGQNDNTDSMYLNNDSRNNYYEAQKRADMYMKIKDRRPMVFEYLQMGTPEKWVSITMYINPDKLSISQQKVKGKQITRGGIFYHHWGDDHPVLSLSGTTGYSGMKGIEALENIYHASGTLLRYQQFGPSNYLSDNLSTLDNGVIVNDVDINRCTSVMNSAVDSNSKSYVEDLKNVVAGDSTILAAWAKYKENKRIVEGAQKSNSEMKRLNQRNTDLRKKYYFPDGSGIDRETVEGVANMYQTYKDVWDRYIKVKNDAQWLLDQGQTLAKNRQLQLYHEELKALRAQWKLEPNVENGTYDYNTLKNTIMPQWLAAAEEYVANKRAWASELKNISANGSSGTKVDLESLMKENDAFRATYGFPDGTYSQIAAMPAPVTNNSVGDLKVLTAKLLSHYLSTLQADEFIAKIYAVDDKLATYKKSTPSVRDYSNYALTEFRKIQGLDASIITQLAYQRTMYYAQELESKGIITDSPIPYGDDVVGQLSSIYSDRAAALNQVMQDVLAFEQKEKTFFEELRSNSMNDIMDDIKDDWRPRRIFVYYENRVYIGHFDSFSYSRDAANPLLIRYEMRLTIEKQIIGSSKG